MTELLLLTYSLLSSCRTGTYIDKSDHGCLRVVIFHGVNFELEPIQIPTSSTLPTVCYSACYAQPRLSLLNACIVRGRTRGKDLGVCASHYLRIPP